MATIGDVMTEDLWLDCVDDILKDNQQQYGMYTNIEGSNEYILSDDNQQLKLASEFLDDLKEIIPIYDEHIENDILTSFKVLYPVHSQKAEEHTDGRNDKPVAAFHITFNVALTLDSLSLSLKRSILNVVNSYYTNNGTWGSFDRVSINIHSNDGGIIVYIDDHYDIDNNKVIEAISRRAGENTMKTRIAEFLYDGKNLDSQEAYDKGLYRNILIELGLSADVIDAVVAINGDSIDTYNDLLYYHTGYNDLGQING